MPGGGPCAQHHTRQPRRCTQKPHMHGGARTHHSRGTHARRRHPCETYTSPQSELTMLDASQV